MTFKQLKVMTFKQLKVMTFKQLKVMTFKQLKVMTFVFTIPCIPSRTRFKKKIIYVQRAPFNKRIDASLPIKCYYNINQVIGYF